MKVYRGTVASVADLTKSGLIDVNLPTPLEPVTVTYMSPRNNLDGGIFAPPTPNSEVLILSLDANDVPGDAAGYYYLGSVVGSSKSLAGAVTESPTGEELFHNIESAAGIETPGGSIDLTSLGCDVAAPPTAPFPIVDRIYANQATPEIMAFLDKGNAGLILYDQMVGGDGAADAWINSRTRLRSGTGKKIDLIDTPAMDYIKITTGKAEGAAGEDYILLGGKQTGIGAESNNVQGGEFRVDSHGPSNLTSRNKGIELRANGLNIDILNDADGLFAPDPDGRKMINPGGQDPYWPLEGDDEALTDFAPPGTDPAALEEVRRDLGGYPILPKPSLFGKGQAHPDGSPPGAHPFGGNPLEKGGQKFGCINLRSKWNNINIEAQALDSVIHINAPQYFGKIVITTGGTVDIIAEQKITLTSNEKIELNAPHIDLNTPTAHPLAPGGKGRIDLD